MKHQEKQPYEEATLSLFALATEDILNGDSNDIGEDKDPTQGEWA